MTSTHSTRSTHHVRFDRQPTQDELGVFVAEFYDFLEGNDDKSIQNWAKEGADIMNARFPETKKNVLMAQFIVYARHRIAAAQRPTRRASGRGEGQPESENGRIVRLCYREHERWHDAFLEEAKDLGEPIAQLYAWNAFVKHMEKFHITREDMDIWLNTIN